MMLYRILRRSECTMQVLAGQMPNEGSILGTSLSLETPRVFVSYSFGNISTALVLKI